MGRLVELGSCDFRLENIARNVRSRSNAASIVGTGRDGTLGMRSPADSRLHRGQNSLRRRCVLRALIGPEYEIRVAETEGSENVDIETRSEPLLEEWEGHLQRGIVSNERLQPTEREALVQARGRNVFKARY